MKHPFDVYFEWFETELKKWVDSYEKRHPGRLKEILKSGYTIRSRVDGQNIRFPWKGVRR